MSNIREGIYSGNVKSLVDIYLSTEDPIKKDQIETFMSKEGFCESELLDFDIFMGRLKDLFDHTKQSCHVGICNMLKASVSQSYNYLVSSNLSIHFDQDQPWLSAVFTVDAFGEVEVSLEHKASLGTWDGGLCWTFKGDRLVPCLSPLTRSEMAIYRQAMELGIDLRQEEIEQAISLRTGTLMESRKSTAMERNEVGFLRSHGFKAELG